VWFVCWRVFGDGEGGGGGVVCCVVGGGGGWVVECEIIQFLSVVFFVVRILTMSVCNSGSVCIPVSRLCIDVTKY